MNIKGVSAMSTLERIENLKDTECIVDMLLKEVRANPCQACGKCVFGYEGITQLELTLSAVSYTHLVSASAYSAGR